MFVAPLNIIHGLIVNYKCNIIIIIILSTAGYQIVSSPGAVRDAKEYLTGVGIYKACCADNQDSSVIVRPNERIVPHWLTFHMRL